MRINRIDKILLFSNKGISLLEYDFEFNAT